MSQTSIQWTDRTWNPVRGCSVVSPGCVNCYAMKQAHRFSGPGKAYEGLTKQTKSGPQWTGKIRTVDSALGEPQRWKKPQRVFVNSMSDLFHDGVPDQFIADVWRTMATVRRHTYQILTKRPERMRALMPRLVETFGVLPNVWLGVSAEDQEHADDRIPWLTETPAAIRFVSAEPLIGPIDFSSPVLEADSVETIDWVIVGGESGHGARRCDTEWIRSIIEQCRAAGVACFVKQLGSNPLDSRAPVRNFVDALAAVGAFMKDKKGGDPNDWAPHMRVREFPRSAVPA